ncbi:MAG: hypothetical protein DRN08_03575 [Thermoplasmata archaeon]|nr:MAG: hypothetical protein DRN08_03575 [Thermoplasmata archaeon]
MTNNKKEEQEQLRNAEKKYQSLIEKRNELNDIARLIREERDMLNKKRKELKEQMEKNKKERDELVAKMKHHKELRNQLQQQAKELIKAKQKKKGHVLKSLPLRVEELKADIQMLEYKQETTPMNTQEENELIEMIRKKRMEYEEAKKQLEKQKLIETDLSDTDQAITELFKKADEEHEKVLKYYKESQKKHEEFMKLIQEIAASINESNKKHQKYVEIKEEAQKIHEKAMEMRSKIISIKKERRRRWEESKRILEQQNIKAQQLVMDEKKLEEIADESIDALKKGKKISLSG